LDWRIGLSASILALILVPMIAPIHLLTLITEVLIFALFAMSLDLMVGYTRLYSFGHAAAYGYGAFSMALIVIHLELPLLLAIIVAVGITAVTAIPVAWVCTRAHGVSFAMLTLAFAQLGYATIFQGGELLGGSDGISGIPRIEGPFGFDGFSGKTGYFYLVSFCLVGAYLFCRSVVRSPFGAVLSGIKENEEKTKALGYNTRQYKMGAVILSYSVGGLAGALYVGFAGFVSPELFFWLLSGQVLLMVIVGGAGTLIGPIIGAIFFLSLEHQLARYTDVWPLIFGAIFIFFVLFAPQGIWGVLTDLIKRRKKVITNAPD
jgi:branched-chain amino acid transport system permease protein